MRLGFCYSPAHCERLGGGESAVGRRRGVDGSLRLRFWVVCLVAFLAVSAVVRLGLAGWVWGSSDAAVGPLLVALLAGPVDDLAVAVPLGLPFLLGLVLLRGFWRWRIGTALAHLVLLALCTVLVFSAVAEFFFWNEFASRFNGIAVNYLIFPKEVVGNLQESFDFRIWLPPILALGVGLYWLLRGRLSRALEQSWIPGERRWALVVAAGAGLLSAAPLAWPLPPLAEHREINEVQGNGLHRLFSAALTNDAEYDGLYPTLADQERPPLVRAAVAQPNVRFLDDDPASIRRHVDNGEAGKRLHVVLVIEESFGITYVDGLGNKRGYSITPNLNRLAQDGLFFTNLYATGDRTVRGLEAILTSFTPIPGISTARRPGAQGMNSLPFLLRRFGYRSGFLYGGIAAFDNMGAFWQGIGFDDVWDLFDIEDKGFTTVWGAADEFLFTEALKRMDRHARPDQPFFLGLLTVSNHRPFTFPEDRFRNDPAKGRKENAAGYADFAFGDFVEKARSHPWFEDTVFIFIGDHGPRITGAREVPVEGFRVPLLFYSPKHIAPQRSDVLASSLDVTPTLMGLLGLSYESPFFGLDLLRLGPGEGRITMAHNFSIAYGSGGQLAVLQPSRKTRTYRLDGQPETRRADDVLRQAIAVVQSAHRMFYGQGYHVLSR